MKRCIQAYPREARNHPQLLKGEIDMRNTYNSSKPHPIHTNTTYLPIPEALIPNAPIPTASTPRGYTTISKLLTQAAG